MPTILSAVAVANEYREELVRLEGSAMRSMLRTWKGVEEALVLEFERFLELHPHLYDLTPGQILRLERFQTLQLQVQAQIQAFGGVAGPLVSAGQVQAAQLGALQAAETLDALGLAGNFNRLSTAATQNIVGISRVGRPLQQLLAPMYHESTTGILRELTKGVALGRGPKEIARRMAKDGLTDSLNHLLLVTRDQFNRAHRTAALQRYEESGVVSGYVRRCARQPGRTCIACIALDGYFYKLKDEFEGHPQDRCVMIPAVKGIDTKPLSDGKTWFKNLPEDEQILAMGPGRWEQWRSGELQWHQMVQRRKDKVWGVSVTPRPVGFQRTKRPPRVKPAAKPTPKPPLTPKSAPTPAPVDDLFPDDIGGLENVRGLGGSTGAMLVRDPKTGRQFVMKRGASPEHVRREMLADDAYRALGANVPRGRIFETPQGPVKLTEFVDGKSLRQAMNGDVVPGAIKRQLQKDFATDALLGNRDVIGEAFDNVLIDAEGKVWRIDNGGAFNFRAQGGNKTYDRYPMELWSMRDPKINRQTAAVFGDMEYADVVTGLRITSARGRDFLNSLPPELRDGFSGRLDMYQRATGLFDEFTATNWKPEYMDLFTYFDFRLRQEGVVDRLPKKLSTQRGESEVELYDEKKQLFDKLRGQGSVMYDVRSLIEQEGGDWGMISYYLGQQSGSSWSSGAVAVKEHIARNMNLPARGSVYWENRAEAKRQYEMTIERFGRERAETSWTAFHAWNYNLVSEVEMPNNNRAAKTIRLLRTEDIDVMKRYNLSVGAQNAIMPRGMGESSSLMREVYVNGSELTVQDVPHSRVFASYLYSRRPDVGGASLHSDGENEFVFIPFGIPFNYAKSRYGG